MKKVKLLIIISLMAFVALQAQVNSVKRLKSDVQFLADDLLKGRNTPSEGLDMAALYLANQLEACGWVPASNGTYFQKVPLVTFEPSKSDCRVILNGVELQPDEYILSTRNMKTDNTTQTHELVFLGQGIFLPEKNINDFKGVDMEGKAGIAFFGAPWEMNTEVIQSCGYYIDKRIQVNTHKGSFLIYVTPELDASENDPISFEVPFFKRVNMARDIRLADEDIKASAYSSMLMISPKTFDKTLAAVTGKSYEQWQARLKPPERLTSFPVNAKVSIKVKAEKLGRSAYNVVALKKSDDPVCGKEWVWLTAHYDHLGMLKNTGGKDSIHNGADDNASGTAVVIELVRKLAEIKDLRRSVMVTFFCGEEIGLLGSGYGTTHSLVPLDKVVLNMNADMVGRYVDRLTCTTIGCDELYEQAKKLGATYNLNVLPDLTPEVRMVYYTDCYNFLKNDIPFIEFFTGFHANYHQPSDEAKWINYEAMDKITQLLFDFAVSYINNDQHPIIKRPVGYLTSH